MRVSDEKKREIRVAAAKQDWDFADFLRVASDRLLDELEEGELGDDPDGSGNQAQARMTAD